ncbi:MAG TPA: hypothetical protein VM030_08510, partial [Acidimicrobiales bacterium]|nr:hypothetical protein [Acidimicrobiales bacterium]
AVRRLTRVTMPVIGRMPISVLYPTGSKQETNTPKFAKEWAAADLLAGDFLYMRKYAPENLAGKTVVTNTTTADDVEFLRGRGVQWLITTTPRLDGRSFGTNAFEAALTAAAGKGRPLTDTEIDDLIDELELRPAVERLNP